MIEASPLQIQKPEPQLNRDYSFLSFLHNLRGLVYEAALTTNSIELPAHVTPALGQDAGRFNPQTALAPI
jgi:hypothetical protein